MNDVISIIIPAYNVENYLSKCLNSILSQTYPHIEAVIVDDGSEDRTAEIADEYAHMYPERVTVLHVPNGGVTQARLTGVGAARGQWIGFVDADDYVESDMYERLINNAHNYQAKISHCGYQLDLPNEVVYYYNTGRLVQQDTQEGLKALLDGSYIEPGLCNKLFRKTLFHSLLHMGIMDVTLRNTEDLLMNYYLFHEAEKSVYEDFCPYHYVLRLDSATTKKINENKVKDPLRVIKILLTETEDNAEHHNAVYKRYIRLLCNAATTQVDKENEWLSIYRKEVRAELRNSLLKTLVHRDLGIRIKLIALGAGLMPDVYGWFHRLHTRINNLDKTRSLKKEEIE